MKSQQLKGLKLTAKTFLGESCNGEIFGKKKFMDIFFKTNFRDIVNYDSVNVENWVKCFFGKNFCFGFFVEKAQNGPKMRVSLMLCVIDTSHVSSFLYYVTAA